MKLHVKILNIAIALIAVLISPAHLAARSLAEKADSLYEKQDYQQAAELYNQCLSTEGTSSDIYYNLGNAYYRLGRTSQAILAYERALRLNPANTDARTNLEFVNARIVDKKGETGSFIYNTIVDITNLAHSNTWAILAMVAFILTIAGVCVYIFLDRITLRKIGFFGSIITALLFVAFVLLSINARSIAEDTSNAIITAETSMLSTVPRTPANHDEEAMLLHEGTKVRILRTIALQSDSIGNTWHEVQVDNRHRAWINNADIEKIKE